MKDIQISVVIPCHSETHWLLRAARSVLLQLEPPPFEVVFVCDRASDATVKAVAEAVQEIGNKAPVQTVTIDAGDLGTARNEGVKVAQGRFVSFLDADDLFGCRWLRQAFEYARRFDHDDFVLHPAWSLMFGAAHFIHRHFSSTAPEFAAKDMVQFNPWSALAFAPKALLERFPYRVAFGPWGYEDWQFNAETMGAGIEHHCVEDAVHLIRMKLNQSSMAARMTQQKLSIPRMELFDKRNLLPAQCEPNVVFPSNEVLKQALFAHHKVGEFRVQVDPQVQLRTYPRQVIFDDQAWLRDQIGGAKHVVLVHELKPGGAEKYALDWCAALRDRGEDFVLIETAPAQSQWLERAERVARAIRWFKRRQLQPNEVAYAIQRALIQCQLQSLFVCNSELGWALVHENPAALAQRVIAASFSIFPLPNGYTSCPPFYLERQPGNVSILTDNNRHADRLLKFGMERVQVVPPRVTYGGTSKLRQTKDGRLRLLWAGRGSHEKGPHLPPLIAASMPSVDIHMWGDVPPMLHALPNLHYRGPFESFEAIDGAYDAYLLTSSHEGMPNTALEAIAAGLPVIASDVGDVKTIAAKVFAPPGNDQRKNVEAACEAIQEFAASRDTYKPAVAEAIVEGWRRTFADSVAALVGAS